jgi:hypothetical protein
LCVAAFGGNKWVLVQKTFNTKGPNGFLAKQADLLSILELAINVAINLLVGKLTDGLSLLRGAFVLE